MSAHDAPGAVFTMESVGTLLWHQRLSLHRQMAIYKTGDNWKSFCRNCSLADRVSAHSWWLFRLALNNTYLKHIQQKNMIKKMCFGAITS